jgi:hypothetical protein
MAPQEVRLGGQHRGPAKARQADTLAVDVRGLVKSYQGRARIRYRQPAGATLPDGLSGPPGPDGYTEITSDDVVQALHQLTGWAIDHGASLDGLEVTRPSLEDIYLLLTSAPPGDGGDEPAPAGNPDGGAA